MVWLKLQPGKQQRDRLVVTAGLQMGGNGGSAWNLPRLGLPVHLDLPVAEPHIHPAASFAVGVLVVSDDGLAEGLAAPLPGRLR